MLDQLTQAQQLRPLKEALGRPLHLLPYQSVKAVKVYPTFVCVELAVMHFTETAREVRFTKSGLMMKSWKLVDGYWQEQETLTVWDEDFVPYIEARFGVHRSVEETREQAQWEAETYRCGSRRTPMDSFARTVEGGRDTTTPAMFKYWTSHEMGRPYSNG